MFEVQQMLNMNGQKAFFVVRLKDWPDSFLKKEGFQHSDFVPGFSLQENELWSLVGEAINNNEVESGIIRFDSVADAEQGVCDLVNDLEKKRQPYHFNDESFEIIGIESAMKADIVKSFGGVKDLKNEVLKDSKSVEKIINSENVLSFFVIRLKSKPHHFLIDFLDGQYDFENPFFGEDLFWHLTKDKINEDNEFQNEDDDMYICRSPSLEEAQLRLHDVVMRLKSEGCFFHDEDGFEIIKVESSVNAKTVKSFDNVMAFLAVK